jgi:pimeloyl-ACP methyl ester carboxylesterase
MLGWCHTRPHRVQAELARGDFANLLKARPAVAALFRAAYLFEVGEAAEEVPTTVAWSARDLVLLPYQARRARTLLPNAQHLWLPRCGHVPMPDDPALVAETIRAGAGQGRTELRRTA